MANPFLIPGTGSIAYTAATSTAPDVLTVSESGSPTVLNAINAADYTQQPAVLVFGGIVSPGAYTGSGATATLGGNSMSLIITSGGSDGIVNRLSFMALLPYNASTIFPDADFVITVPGMGTGGPPYVFGASVPVKLFYGVDPTINAGFGAGFHYDSSPGGTVLSAGPVTAIAGDLALAQWTNGAASSNPSYIITAPSDFTVHTTSGGLGNFAEAYGTVGSSGAYNATATWAGGFFAGAAVIVALLRGSPPGSVVVPDVVGDTVPGATAALVAVGLILGAITGATSLTVPAGIVLSQSPIAGAGVLTGDPVALVLSAGPPPTWSLTPNWDTPVREKIGFLTDVMLAWTGVEQRRALRLAPRRAFIGATLAQTAEKRFIENALFANSAVQWVFPIFPDGQRLSAAITAGDSSITCDTVNRDFVAGGLAIAINTALNFELFQVNVISSGSFTLSGTAVANWPIGTKFYPARLARLLSYPNIVRESAQLFTMTPEFTIDEPCDWPAASGLPMYRTFPVLEDSPDLSVPGAGMFGRIANITDPLTGAIDVDDTALLGFPENSHQWYLKGRAARAAFRSLLYLLKGRQAEIWVPSYEADIVIAESIGSSDTTLTVEAGGFTQLGAVQNRQDIRLELYSGTVYYRRVTGAAPSGAQELLAIDTSLGAAVALNQIRRVSFMALSRLNADEIEIQHWGMADGIATATTPFRAVNDNV